MTYQTPIYDPINDVEFNSPGASIASGEVEDLALLALKPGNSRGPPRRIVRFHELARETGVRIQSTAPDGAARAAGLLTGDIIVAVDGSAVGDVDELHRLMTEERVGRPVPVTVLRLAQKLDVVVTPRESAPRAAA